MEQFRAVWEFTSDAIAVSDKDGIVLDANPAYFALYGYTPAEIIGKPYTAIFSPEARLESMTRYQVIFAAPHNANAAEAVIRRADGSERFVESRYDFIIENGQRVAMISIVRDITKRKQAEAERDDLLVREQAARQQAERAEQRAQEALAAQHEADARKDRFISVASHELRTPLTAIKGFTQMLQRLAERETATSGIERMRRMLKDLDAQINRTNRLIGEMLDVSRIQSGQLTLNLQPDTNIVALARQVVEQQNEQSSHNVQVEAPTDSITASVDPDRIEQVLNNLISNARKYSRAGTDVVVRVEACQPPDAVCIRVSDQGIGIAPDDLTHIFDQFYRASGDPTIHVEGLGLGLYITADIVARHGGRIWVESEVGIGSTFFVTLPFVPPNTTA